jgi:hypothetical protein
MLQVVVNRFFRVQESTSHRLSFIVRFNELILWIIVSRKEHWLSIRYCVSGGGRTRCKPSPTLLHFLVFRMESWLINNRYFRFTEAEWAISRLRCRKSRKCWKRREAWWFGKVYAFSATYLLTYEFADGIFDCNTRLRMHRLLGIWGVGSKFPINIELSSRAYLLWWGTVIEFSDEFPGAKIRVSRFVASWTLTILLMFEQALALLRPFTSRIMNVSSLCLTFGDSLLTGYEGQSIFHTRECQKGIRTIAIYCDFFCNPWYGVRRVAFLARDTIQRWLILSDIDDAWGTGWLRKHNIPMWVFCSLLSAAGFWLTWSSADLKPYFRPIAYALAGERG